MHVVASTLSDPLGETSHWTGALMWKAATVSPVWWANDPRPRGAGQFELSNDPEFANGPRQRMKKGRAGTMTHTRNRHGTKTLLAALHVGVGTVICRF
jgi:hypothetical protein